MLKAVFAADYGSDTGMGHLTRCGVLAEELSDSFSITFAAANDEYFPRVSKFAGKIGASAVKFDELNYIGHASAADLIVIDSYKTTTKMLTDVKNFYSVCAVIDDNAALPFYDADFVINHNIGAEKLSYVKRKDTELLLGLNYLLLRSDFTKRTPIDISQPVKNIAVTMGGADLKNTTEKILRFVEKRAEYTFNVVIGSDFKNSDILEQYEKKAGNIKLCRNADMAEVFSKCQGAIAACGVTIYELAALGVPSIGVVTADNQQNASIEMENIGIIASAGLSEKLSDWYFDRLFEDVFINAEIRERMHKKQLELVSGSGAKTIKERILNRF